MRPILRFLLWVALPAPLVLGVLWASVDRVQEDQHRLGMERLGRAAAMLFQQDLGRATVALSRIAEPWPEADPEDPAVQAAAAGDTLSGMATSSDGVRISLVMPDLDAPPSPDGTSSVAVKRAVGRLRSKIIEDFRGLTGLGSAFYLNGAWAAGDSLAPAALPGDWLAHVENNGGFAEFDLAGGHAFLLPAADPDAPNASAASAALLLLEREPPRGPIGPFAVAIPILLLLASIGVVIRALSPTSGPGPAPKMAMAGLTALLVTVVGCGGWAASRGIEASKGTSIRELSRAGALMHAYNRLEDPETGAALTGHRAIFINNAGTVHTSDGSQPPIGVESLPSPPPAFPAAGRLASSGEVFLVMKSENGRSVLLLPRYQSSLPLWVAILGGLIIAFGTTMFLRGDLVEGAMLEGDLAEGEPTEA